MTHHLAVGALLLATATASASTPGDCRDPWITRAVQEAAGRAPRGSGDAGECDLRLYGARWDSYEELRAQVDAALAALRAASLEHDADGRALLDSRRGRRVSLVGVYLGPDRRAPARQVTVALARDHVLAFDWPAPADRRPAPPPVRPGEAPVPPQE